MPLSENKIQALLTLLGDEDERTVQFLKNSLVDIGPSALPLVLTASRSASPMIQERLQGVIEALLQQSLEEEFQNWVNQDDTHQDLEEGVFLLARFAYPELNFGPYVALLDDMTRTLASRLATCWDLQSRILEINRTLFEEWGFRGNSENFYDPDNSYIHRVLERRTGIPISLSVIYLLLARRVGVPLEGIGLPGHFMLRYDVEGTVHYLDAFNGGKILSKEGCTHFLVQSGYEVQEPYFEPITSAAILIRMIRNLIYIYAQTGEVPKTQRLRRLIPILEGH